MSKAKERKEVKDLPSMYALKELGDTTRFLYLLDQLLKQTDLPGREKIPELQKIVIRYRKALDKVIGA